MRPEADDLTWSQVRTGAVILAVLAVVLAVVFLSDVVARELSEGPQMVVSATEARDLEPGSRVWIAGVPAGRVTDVRFREPGRNGARPVLVRAVVREEAARLVRADATASIRSSALLAPAVLSVEPGTSSRRFDFSDTLIAVPLPGREEIMARADSLLGALDRLRPLAARLRSRLREGPGTLAALRGDPALAESLERMAEAGMRLAGEIPRGSAARIAADTALHDRMRRLRRRLRTAAGQGDGTPGEGERPDLASEVEELVRRLERLGAGLRSGRGTLGRLARDEALRRERRLLEARVDSVRAALLAEPLRWLRFRLF